MYGMCITYNIHVVGKRATSPFVLLKERRNKGLFLTYYSPHIVRRTLTENCESLFAWFMQTLNLLCMHMDKIHRKWCYRKDGWLRIKTATLQFFQMWYFAMKMLIIIISDGCILTKQTFSRKKNYDNIRQRSKLRRHSWTQILLFSMKPIRLSNTVEVLCELQTPISQDRSHVIHFSDV